MYDQNILASLKGRVPEYFFVLWFLLKFVIRASWLCSIIISELCRATTELWLSSWKVPVTFTDPVKWWLQSKLMLLRMCVWVCVFVSKWLYSKVYVSCVGDWTSCFHPSYFLLCSVFILVLSVYLLFLSPHITLDLYIMFSRLVKRLVSVNLTHPLSLFMVFIFHFASGSAFSKG